MNQNKITVRIPTCGEWDTLMNTVGEANELTHWKDMESWCLDEELNRPAGRMIRGGGSARFRNSSFSGGRDNYVGFRPVFETAAPDAAAPDGTLVSAAPLYMDDEPVRVPQNPVEDGDILDYVPGAKLDFRPAIKDPAYQVQAIRVGNLLIADRVLLKNISWDDLEEQGFCHAPAESGEMQIKTPLGTIIVKKAVDSDHPGVYIDLRRPGCEVDVPLAMVEYARDEADTLNGEPHIISRIWGDVREESYSDRVIHEGIEEFFKTAVEEGN